MVLFSLIAQGPCVSPNPPLFRGLLYSLAAPRWEKIRTPGSIEPYFLIGITPPFLTFPVELGNPEHCPLLVREVYAVLCAYPGPVNLAWDMPWRSPFRDLPRKFVPD